ncbi:hypothetical protein F5X99DRAFT_368783 [Biscogniauxia marginata]|nr:hypothetical protein F5X99DRAFT_368783 [Biscogniauxia marginata]
MDKIYIVSTSRGRPHQNCNTPHWEIRIQINEHDFGTSYLRDPCSRVFYESELNDYVRESANVLAIANSLDGSIAVNRHRCLSEWDDHLNTSGQRLLDSLRLDEFRRARPGAFINDATGCIITIIEEEDGTPTRDSRSIHSLKWELLEGIGFGSTWPPRYSAVVSRVFDDKNGVRFAHAETLSSMQIASSGVVKILLVIARDLTKTGNNRDVEPDLTRRPLMELHERLNHGRPKFMLEIVRPGSLNHLNEHLKKRREHGVNFNIIHFDLHGDDDIQSTPAVCRLIFATGRSDNPKGIVSEEVKDVAKTLLRYRIENIVMTSCWSAYEEAGETNNMARLFIRSNVRNVLAVWGKIGTHSVSAFNEVFYKSLLDNHHPSFESAAHDARQSLRFNNRRWPGERQYRDDFLFLHYSRDNPRVSPIQSSYWKSYIKSVLKFPLKRSLRPRAGDVPQIRQGHNVQIKLPKLLNSSIITLKLLFLELETYLETYRVIYASDSREHQEDMRETIKSLAKVWLSTNFIDQVLFHKLELRHSNDKNVVSRWYEEMHRHTPGSALIHRLPPALGGTLHVFDSLDDIFTAIIAQPHGDGNASRTADRKSIIDKFRKFLLELDKRDYVIILGFKLENDWMPREWRVPKCPIRVQFWSHGSSIYSDELDWPNTFESQSNYSNRYQYGY